MDRDQINIFLNSLNAKEGAYRHLGYSDLEFYFNKSQRIIYELLDIIDELKNVKGENNG